MSIKSVINEKFIIRVQGSEFVKYEGLLDLAHQKGLKSIKTEIIELPSSENGNTCIVKAVCTTEDGDEFHGIGDAAPNSVNRMIAPHLIRMSETRAKARALRDLTNVGMTAFEEITINEEPLNYKNKSNKNNNIATSSQLNTLVNLAKDKNYTEHMPNYIKKNYKKNSSKELTKQEASELIKLLQNMKKIG